jgi:hypothetical protein
MNSELIFNVMTLNNRIHADICRDIQTFSMLLELILCYMFARKVHED